MKETNPLNFIPIDPLYIFQFEMKKFLSTYKCGKMDVKKWK